MAKGSKKIMIDFMKSIKENPLRYYYIQSHLKKLEEDGIDLSTQGNGGNSLLHLAVSLENKKLLKMFINAKVRLDLANDNGETPLHKAISKGNVELIKILIKSGCDINCPREMEQTPLHLAVICGKIEVVRLLVDNGADIAFDGPPVAVLLLGQGHKDPLLDAQQPVFVSKKFDRCKIFRRIVMEPGRGKQGLINHIFVVAIVLSAEKLE